MIHVALAKEGGPEVTSRPPTYKEKYIITGTANSAAAKSALKAFIPPVVINEGHPLYIQDVQLSRKADSQTVWEGSVEWGLKVFPVTFDTSGGTAKLTCSKQTRGIYTNTSTPDFKGGIGYNGDGFEGVDITIPNFSWTETFTFQLSQLNWSYVMTLAQMTGKVNSASFRGFAAGEVLFLGASGGNQKNDTEADVSFKFAAAPNATGLSVAGINGITKHGWDYLWVYYKQDTAEGLGNDPKMFKLKVPTGVYVERVYDYANFSALGIG